MIRHISQAKPRHIILNPRTENDVLAKDAEKAGIEVIIGCTLVMLGAGNF